MNLEKLLSDILTLAICFLILWVIASKRKQIAEDDKAESDRLSKLQSLQPPKVHIRNKEDEIITDLLAKRDMGAEK